MTWAPPEPEDDDAERMATALAPYLRSRIEALLKAPLMPKDRDLVAAMARRDPKTLTPDHRQWISGLLWKYRRSAEIPASMRPKLNPDDPIVRAMEDAGV